MANELTRRIVDFFKHGASLHGVGVLRTAAASAVVAGVAMGAAFATELSEGGHLLPEETSMLVAEIQAELDRELPGAGILVNDPGLDSLQQLSAFEDSGREASCVVYIAPLATDGAIPGVALGDIPPAAYARWMVYTGVAHCLGAASGEHAKVFGTLMTFKDTGSTDFAPVIAAWTDLNELRGHIDEPSFWSESAWAAANALEDDRFTAALGRSNALDVLDYANDIWTPADTGLKAVYGRAFREAALPEHFFVPVRGGILQTDGVTWAHLLAEDVSPVARFLELVEYLHGEDPEVREDFTPTPIDWTQALKSFEELGLRGDSTSRVLARALGSDIDFDYEVVVRDEHQIEADVLRGVFYTADLTGLYLTYDSQGRGFAATTEDRRPVLMGLGPQASEAGEFRTIGRIIRATAPADDPTVPGPR